jgi:hypothetical protein
LVAEIKMPVFSRTSNVRHKAVELLADGLIAGKGKALDFANAEPQVFSRVLFIGHPISSKAIAIGF